MHVAVVDKIPAWVDGMHSIQVLNAHVGWLNSAASSQATACSHVIRMPLSRYAWAGPSLLHSHLFLMYVYMYTMGFTCRLGSDRYGQRWV